VFYFIVEDGCRFNQCGYEVPYGEVSPVAQFALVEEFLR
jgi:hypothetical protein